jgi:hypothetical protein
MTTARIKRSHSEPSPIDHRAVAEHALEDARTNPVTSPDRSLLAAQVHALLAIEQTLVELLERQRQPAARTRTTLARARLREARAAG